VVNWGIALPDAVAMHSGTPAGLLGLHQELEQGGPADLVLLDGDLRVQGVLRAGVAVPGLPLSEELRGSHV
jgi:N-acetylglucosamine-6-phosphate deacetylase